MILDIAQKNNPGPMMEPFHYVFFSVYVYLMFIEYVKLAIW